MDGMAHKMSHARDGSCWGGRFAALLQQTATASFNPVDETCKRKQENELSGFMGCRNKRWTV